MAARRLVRFRARDCVAADCGLATDEIRAWLAMLVDSPLVS
jgi:hypothetical protein